MTVGDNIKILRQYNSMTQKQLAEASGLADSTIRAYELGRANPKPATAVRIAEALNVPISELYAASVPQPEDKAAMCRAMFKSITSGPSGKDNPPVVQDQDDKDLLQASRALNHDGKRELINRIYEMLCVPKYRREPDEYDK